jgi:hypothetical protein
MTVGPNFLNELKGIPSRPNVFEDFKNTLKRPPQQPQARKPVPQPGSSPTGGSGNRPTVPQPGSSPSVSVPQPRSTPGVVTPPPSSPRKKGGSGGGGTGGSTGTGGADTGNGTSTGESEADRLERLLEEQRRLAQMQRDAQIAAQRQSAYDIARELANAYDIGEGIVDRIINLVKDKGYTATAVRLAIQDTPEYKERFKGIQLYNQNFASDIAAGKKAAALTPADYIKAEKDYQEILTRYGLGNLATRDTYAQLIGGAVSAAEVTDRITNVYDKIRNADEVLKSQLADYFPDYNESDFAEVLLTGTSPEDMANRLKNKLSAAEISSEASRAGLGLDVRRAMELQSMGVSRTLARAGYSKIAEQQARLGTLGAIYQTDVTDLQTELEAEQFQGLASERRKRLTEQEKASFAGSAGVTQVSLQQRTAGQF